MKPGGAAHGASVPPCRLIERLAHHQTRCTGGWSCGSALILLRRERRGQPAQPPKRRRLDGSEGKLKASGDLGLGVATEVGQREHLALLLGQVAERVAYL